MNNAAHADTLTQSIVIGIGDGGRSARDLLVFLEPLCPTEAGRTPPAFVVEPVQDASSIDNDRTVTPTTNLRL